MGKGRRVLITEAQLVNEGKSCVADMLIEDGRILRIDPHISDPHAEVIAAAGHYLLPGLIDTHVHFREPGHPEKGTLASESKAAVAGGVTSFLEMPNTLPATTTGALLEEKYRRAAHSSVANYGFYIGATKNNIDALLTLPTGTACGVKVFMGSSTGNLLVEDEAVLTRIFSEVPMLIAVHCEEESIISRKKALPPKEIAKLTAADHPRLRPREACLASTKKAISLAQKYHTQLHILHITTKEELPLFTANEIENKHITAEGCMQQLTFCAKDYATQGNRIKVNPAIKQATDKAALWKALKENKLDIIGSDHAPHTLVEKNQPYWQAPSGAPMVEHSLYVLLEACRAGDFSLTQLVEKYAHNPARRYGIVARGFLREGYHADLVLVKACMPWVLHEAAIVSHCGWSPLVGRKFHYKIAEVLVGGQRVLSKGNLLNTTARGARLVFKKR